MREALGFEANPDANEPAPSVKDVKPGEVRERRSRTSNKDREDRQKKYEDLIVLGFPSNQFGNQEPKSNKEIQEFVKNKNVTFPVFAKIDVNGSKEDPLYTYLKNKKRGFLSKDITWNYTKFLCIDGVPVKRYGPQENPKSFENDIKKYI